MKGFKFHWGHGLAVAMLIFMTGILTVVFSIGDFDLMKEDYYEPDSIVNEHLVAQRRVLTLPDSIRPKVELDSKKGIRVLFSSNWQAPQTQGKLQLLYFADAKKDINLALKLDSLNQMLIPRDQLSDGLYALTIDWGPTEQDNFRYRIKRDVQWKSK